MRGPGSQKGRHQEKVTAELLLSRLSQPGLPCGRPGFFMCVKVLARSCTIGYTPQRPVGGLRLPQGIHSVFFSQIGNPVEA